ncbi:hypothetical protein GQ55_2G319700 [Panicum hallii var. hallii]|uniref:DRBM domain-containing protein n=1 Tax=Panicum hallii var. hallii TaxID=1504633 RepID=A0A2T7EUL0_9POAL|nr:hypothetical protein GQ55_2G319700 [Panicum hallii var. hallii]
MEVEGGGGDGREVVELEDAVKLLVEHLVKPVLPHGTLRREEALKPENQDAVARQIHATVLLYNYYHRKQFPQLAFADPERFCVNASLTAGEALLVYLQQVHEHHDNGTGGWLSVTDKAVVDACNIAEVLDATKDSPEMIMWPISKVAVLLLNRTKKMCLVEHGSQTKGVLSILEKDITMALGGSRSSDVSVQESSNKSVALPSEPYVLQQIAYSEAELKTGIKRANLRFLEEHRVYSLSKKGTATMMFVLQYEQNINNKLKEMPLEVLAYRMSGSIFSSDPCLATTSVVECYHLLPYKEVLLNILNRSWPLDSSLSAPKERLFQNGNPSSHSEIDESLKEQEANSKSKLKKINTNVSTPKKNKQVVKAVSDSGTNKCTVSKNKKNSNTNSKRKSETFKATLPTYPEHGDGESPAKETDSLAAPDVESLKFMSAKPAKATNGGSVDLQARVQMDKDRREKHSESRNTTQDIILAPYVDPVINNHALESQKEKVTVKSGGITDNMNVQKYATLQLLQKMRDDTLREHCMLGDQSAQYEMEIQTILSEADMTPKVTSILKKYENNWNMIDDANPTCSGKGCQNMNLKRKKLKEAILLRNKCQELDDICRESNWILPRYKVLPSVTGDMYQASVYLMGPDFNLSADGDRKITPHEARDSAASNMLHQLQQKAKEN